MLDAVRHLSAWHPDTSFYLFYSLSINVFFGFQTLKFHSRQKNQSCLASVPLNLVQHMHLLPHVPIHTHTHITFKVGLKKKLWSSFHRTGLDFVYQELTGSLSFPNCDCFVWVSDSWREMRESLIVLPSR